MWWPSPSDYQDAVQNPRVAFSDNELREGVVVSDALGLPKPISGSFATVYQVDYRGRRHAVRCFLRHVPDIAQRYAAISAYLQQAALSFTVEFSFLPQGIRLRGQWFPVLKMDWVEGSRLDVYVAQHLNDPSALLEITRQFLHLADALRHAHIAHGDLQHGNLLVVNHELRLLDYDGMFVPALAGMTSNELGQPNYQHPLRSPRDYDLYLDNFSVWVITLSLLGLALDPELRFSFSGASEALLLQQSDFANPAHSKRLSALQHSPNPTLRALTQSFLTFLFARDLRAIPPLESNAIAALHAGAPTHTNLPDWLRERVGIMPALTPPVAPMSSAALPVANGADWLFDHLQTPPPPRLEGSFRAEKYLLALTALVFFFVVGIMLMGPVDPFLGGVVLALIPSVGVFALTLGFTLRYNSPERRDALRAVRKLEQEQAALTRRIQELEAQRAELEQQEQEALTKLVKQQTDNAAQEQAALAALERDLQNELAKLDAQRQKLAAQETETLAAALQQLQAKHIQRALESYRIADAMLPGIIPREVKQKLAAHGFVTAADIVNFQVNVLNAGKRFCLVNRQGKAVYVEGITPERGVALILWRRTLEARVKRQAPDALSPEMTASLRKKFQDAQISIQVEEIKKKQETANAKTRVTADARQEQARLTREMQELPARARRERESIEQELAQRRKLLAEKDWALVLARRQLANFAHISFFNYLKSILWR
jgi:hypothetical protein